MPIVAVAGDRCTTTAVALAACRPDVILVDADPAGGDLAAWFDLPASPSLSDVVTRVHDGGGWAEIEPFVRAADNGLRLLAGAGGTAEATRAVGEAGRVVVPALASRAVDAPHAVADTGRVGLPPGVHPFVASATVAVVVHRQAPQSTGAAAVRLRRLAEHLDLMATGPALPIVAVIGTAPFGVGEIERFLVDSAGELEVVALPDDPLAAAVLAGRTGVSRRRLRRLPLMRAARELSGVIDGALAVAGESAEVAS